MYQKLQAKQSRENQEIWPLDRNQLSRNQEIFPKSWSSQSVNGLGFQR